jgi:hypothetical protein
VIKTLVHGRYWASFSRQADTFNVSAYFAGNQHLEISHQQECKKKSAPLPDVDFVSTKDRAVAERAQILLEFLLWCCPPAPSSPDDDETIRREHLLQALLPVAAEMNLEVRLLSFNARRDNPCTSPLLEEADGDRGRIHREMKGHNGNRDQGQLKSEVSGKIAGGLQCGQRSLLRGNHDGHAQPGIGIPMTRRSAPSSGVFNLDYLKPLVVCESHSKFKLVVPT